MNEQLRNRLEELRKEFELGQTRLRELEMQEARLRETLLRISGAIQVLEELQSEANAAHDTTNAAHDAPPAAAE